jgi:hypothetical protein
VCGGKEGWVGWGEGDLDLAGCLHVAGWKGQAVTKYLIMDFPARVIFMNVAAQIWCSPRAAGAWLHKITIRQYLALMAVDWFNQYVGKELIQATKRQKL